MVDYDSSLLRLTKFTYEYLQDPLFLQMFVCIIFLNAFLWWTHGQLHNYHE